MSDEHYPARSVGNDDVVALDLIKMLDMFHDNAVSDSAIKYINPRKTHAENIDAIFDEYLSKPLYPKGRTARTLCRKCNTFLGKYDEAYLRFFNACGNPKVVKGFQKHTKYQIIKAIYSKFLSIPEASSEKFDFVDFIKDDESVSYNGVWHLYFIKRDYSTDLFGLKDIRTGKMPFDEGVVYELSDDNFIFNLMNFPKHDCYKMTNIFDILNKHYTLVEGVGADGGYHGQMLIAQLFSQAFDLSK